MRIYLDTSVLVAASIAGHVHHSAAFALVRAVKEGRHTGFIGTHGLAELYSVLTRTPFQPRVHPSEAGRILDENIYPYFKIAALTAKDYQEVLKVAQRSGWMGGMVFDAIHLRSAQKSQCERIYTFNVKDFRMLAPELVDKITAP